MLQKGCVPMLFFITLGAAAVLPLALRAMLVSVRDKENDPVATLLCCVCSVLLTYGLLML